MVITKLHIELMSDYAEELAARCAEADCEVEYGEDDRYVITLLRNAGADDVAALLQSISEL